MGGLQVINIGEGTAEYGSGNHLYEDWWTANGTIDELFVEFVNNIDVLDISTLTNSTATKSIRVGLLIGDAPQPFTQGEGDGAY